MYRGRALQLAGNLCEETASACLVKRDLAPWHRHVYAGNTENCGKAGVSKLLSDILGLSAVAVVSTAFLTPALRSHNFAALVY